MRIKTMMMTAAMVCALVIGGLRTASAHCQIPCGIYGDEMRFQMLNEHITTIRLGMVQVKQLSKNAGDNANQLTRWVNNKDNHADEFAKIVTEYFLQQRIKPDPSDADKAKYQEQLRMCHEMLVYVMKCKQTTDESNADKLSELVKEFKASYMGEDAKKHMEDQHSGSEDKK